jgi:hypothetical protein
VIALGRFGHGRWAQAVTVPQLVRKGRRGGGPIGVGQPFLQSARSLQGWPRAPERSSLRVGTKVVQDAVQRNASFLPHS